MPSLGEVFRRLVGLKSARQLARRIDARLDGRVRAQQLQLAFLLVRKFEFSLAEAGLFAGLLASLPGAISVVAGGRLADRFGATNPAAYARIPGLCLLVAAPIYIFAITRDDVTTLLLLVFVAALFQYTYLGVTFGVFQNLLHPRMRATGSALLNTGLRPDRPGARPAHGRLDERPAGARRNGAGDGLAYAMAITAAIYLWAATHYLLAARQRRRAIWPPCAKVESGDGLAPPARPSFLPFHLSSRACFGAHSAACSDQAGEDKPRGETCVTLRQGRESKPIALDSRRNGSRKQVRNERDRKRDALHFTGRVCKNAQLEMQKAPPCGEAFPGSYPHEGVRPGAAFRSSTRSVRSHGKKVAFGLAAEVAVGGGALVDRLVEAEVRADSARGRAAELVDALDRQLDLVVAHRAGAVGVDIEATAASDTPMA